MRTTILPMLLGAALLLTGCVDDDSGDPPPDDAGILEPQHQALERARGVEDAVAENFERQREAIEEDDGG